jgi:hypothetical protein
MSASSCSTALSKRGTRAMRWLDTRLPVQAVGTGLHNHRRVHPRLTSRGRGKQAPHMYRTDRRALPSHKWGYKRADAANAWLGAVGASSDAHPGRRRRVTGWSHWAA